MNIIWSHWNNIWQSSPNCEIAIAQWNCWQFPPFLYAFVAGNLRTWEEQILIELNFECRAILWRIWRGFSEQNSELIFALMTLLKLKFPWLTKLEIELCITFSELRGLQEADLSAMYSSINTEFAVVICSFFRKYPTLRLRISLLEQMNSFWSYCVCELYQLPDQNQ